MHEIVCAGLPLRVFGLAPDVREPFVIFVAHAREGTAADMDEFCRTLQARVPAAIVVSFDQRNHGHRLVNRTHNNGWEGNPSHPIDMYSIQWGTATDIMQLADMLPIKLGIKPRGFGVTGVSLGGHTALLVAANDARFKIVVAIIGCGDFETMMHHRAAANHVALTSPEYQERVPPALLALLRQRDPIHRASAFAGSSVLMIGGEKDKLVPLQCSSNFLAAIRMHTHNVEDVQTVGVGHRLVPQMTDATAAWFAAHAAGLKSLL